MGVWLVWRPEGSGLIGRVESDLIGRVESDLTRCVAGLVGRVERVAGLVGRVEQAIRIGGGQDDPDAPVAKI